MFEDSCKVEPFKLALENRQRNAFPMHIGASALDGPSESPAGEIAHRWGRKALAEVTYSVVLFIHLESRRVEIAGSRRTPMSGG